MTSLCEHCFRLSGLALGSPVLWRLDMTSLCQHFFRLPGLFQAFCLLGGLFGLHHLSHVTRGLVVSLAMLGLAVSSRSTRSRSFKIGESAFVFEQTFALLPLGGFGLRLPVVTSVM